MTVVRARRKRRHPWALCALALPIAALLNSCGGNDLITYGTAVISFGGTNSGFSAYIVTIDEITLTRTDGLVTEPLANPELFDMSKLHNLTEILTGAAVPVGSYTSMGIVVDYTTPSIFVDVNGTPTVVSPLDNTDAPVLTASLTINFDPANPLVINANQSTRLAVYFDLAAENTITAGSTDILVQPYIVGTPVPEDSTPMRARGLLVTTQPSGSDFIMNVRPFNDLVSALGAITVTTGPSTYFNLNGVTYVGAAGLAAIDSLQESTTMAAYGTLGNLSGITPTFNATAVYAGTSLESALADYITGVVGARTADTLEIHGATSVTRQGVIQYYATLPVTIGSGTLVSEDGVAAHGLSASSISVGQQLTISGQETIDTTTNEVESMDATAGQARLAQTPVWGTLNSAAAGSLSLNALWLGDFEPAAFNFAGTGATAADDAVAASYAVGTGTLNESATPAGTLLQMSGLVTPFGTAPPDFTADTVTAGPATADQQLVVEWGNGGSPAPFTSYSAAGLLVNLQNTHIDSVHYIANGPQRTDLTSLPASPRIVFASGVPLLLSVGNDTLISAYNNVAAFITQLGTTLNGTNDIYRLVCIGQYNSATNTFTASRVSVAMEE